MRGKAEPKRLWQLSGGITPAYAGKSNLLPHTRCRSWDHPRVCGEKMLYQTSLFTPIGSPPRMRGKVKRQQATAPPGQDHPRICGEKIYSSPMARERQGSPPHMRGKGATRSYTLYMFRITPAYAGKRHREPAALRYKRDHPRICGEKPNRILWEHWKEGSPPHMRGKVLPRVPQIDTCGITPAYAGKRINPFGPNCRKRDHPRICGEKEPRVYGPSGPGGSPPHMRGKERGLFVVAGSLRITPAYAGKSKKLAGRKPGFWDHPRICGEKTSFFSIPYLVSGSPPHMRGKATYPAGASQNVGITPAYAGKRTTD